ncbi:MAG: hypothetical protein GXO43_07150 [Crenarchaeota archaeon]|nr:hypothetical protein [Thermoproteota archaeon]
MTLVKVLKDVNKRGVILIIAAIIVLSLTSTFLQETIPVTKTFHDKVIVPPKSLYYVKIPLITGDKYKINWTTSPRTSIQVYLGTSIDPTVLFKQTNLTNYNNVYRISNGTNNMYILGILNPSQDNVTVSYYVTIHTHTVREKFHGIISLIAAAALLIGAILLYHDITENLAKKYPEHRKGKFYECSTSKLTKHVCSIEAPLMEPKLLFEKVIGKLKTMGYKYKGKISDTVHVMERPYRYIRKYGKPCSIIISLEDKLKIYYELPPSVSAGTIDLEWIEKEVREIIKELYGRDFFSENKQFNSSQKR